MRTTQPTPPIGEVRAPSGVRGKEHSMIDRTQLATDIHEASLRYTDGYRPVSEADARGIAMELLHGERMTALPGAISPEPTEAEIRQLLARFPALHAQLKAEAVREAADRLETAPAGELGKQINRGVAIYLREDADALVRDDPAHPAAAAGHESDANPLS